MRAMAGPPGVNSAPTIGVDIGGTKVLAVAVGPDGTCLADAKVPTPATGEAMLDAVAELVSALAPRPLNGRALRAGVGAPGLMDRSGTLQFAPNLPGATSLRMREGLLARLPEVECRFGNDATCAGWAEYVLGAARGSRNALMVTLGTGIGGGIVTEGVVYEGTNGYAGEFGHMVVDPHGPACPCGKRGCWERFASGSGLGRLGREAAEAGRARRVVELAGGDPEAVRGEHVTIAATSGDAEARAVMADFAWWLALGIAGLANVFDPDCIVLGGGLIEAGEVLMEPTRAAFGDLVEAAGQRPGIGILAAALGERAGAMGAALLARTPRPGDMGATASEAAPPP
jgi:glucokinase